LQALELQSNKPKDCQERARLLGKLAGVHEKLGNVPRARYYQESMISVLDIYDKLVAKYRAIKVRACSSSSLSSEAQAIFTFGELTALVREANLLIKDPNKLPAPSFYWDLPGLVDDLQYVALVASEMASDEIPALPDFPSIELWLEACSMLLAPKGKEKPLLHNQDFEVLKQSILLIAPLQRSRPGPERWLGRKDGRSRVFSESERQTISKPVVPNTSSKIDAIAEAVETATPKDNPALLLRDGEDEDADVDGGDGSGQRGRWPRPLAPKAPAVPATDRAFQRQVSLGGVKAMGKMKAKLSKLRVQERVKRLFLAAVQGDAQSAWDAVISVSVSPDHAGAAPAGGGTEEPTETNPTLAHLSGKGARLALADAVYVDSLKSLNEHKFDEAHSKLTKVIEIRLADLGPDNERTALAWKRMADVYFKAIKHGDGFLDGRLKNCLHAVHWYKKSWEVLQKWLTYKETECHQLLLRLTRMLLLAERFGEAFPMSQEVLELIDQDKTSKATKFIQQRKIKALNCLGEACLQTHRQREAVDAFSEAMHLQVQLQADGSSPDPKLIHPMISLGHAHFNMGECAAAEKNFMQALELAKNCNMPENALVWAEIYFGLGMLENVMNKQVLANFYFSEARTKLEAREDSVVKRLMLAGLHVQVAVAHQVAEHPVKALQSFKQSLALFSQELGDESTETAYGLH
jgi:tetratricopeptide (TPR) repeat protein